MNSPQACDAQGEEAGEEKHLGRFYWASGFGSLNVKKLKCRLKQTVETERYHDIYRRLKREVHSTERLGLK